jgi:hypothetical protein
LNNDVGNWQVKCDTDDSFRIRDNGNGSDRLNIDSAGNMGLGVTPESWETGIVALQVGPTSNTFVDTGNSVNRTYNAYSDGSWRYQTASYATNFAHTATGTFMFRTAPSGSADAAISWTTAMTIGNAGQVDFSPFSPSGATEGLNINEVGKIITSANSTASRSRFGFYNPNGNVGNIATSGSSTSYSTSSDYRLKENLVPLTDSIERVKALKPYRFNFLADPDTTVDGFVAHEAGEVVPEAVSGEKDAMRMEEYEITPAVLDDDGNEIEPAVMGEREVIDPQGIDQAKLVPLMCSAIQQLITMNEDLTARVEALEA